MTVTISLEEELYCKLIYLLLLLNLDFFKSEIPYKAIVFILFFVENSPYLVRFWIYFIPEPCILLVWFSDSSPRFWVTLFWFKVQPECVDYYLVLFYLDIRRSRHRNHKTCLTIHSDFYIWLKLSGWEICTFCADFCHFFKDDLESN